MQSRYDHARERLKRKKKWNFQQIMEHQLKKAVAVMYVIHAPAETGTSCQTDLSLKMVASMESELNQLRAKISELKKSTQLELVYARFLFK